MNPEKLTRVDKKRLKACLHFDPKTGFFTWKIKTNRNVVIGSRAGTPLDSGYRAIRLDGIVFLEHRLAWLYHHGKIPMGEIDHEDLCKSNNAIRNLREATPSNQQANVGKNRNAGRGKSGYRGVHVNNCGGKPWVAKIMIKRKLHFLGAFDSVREALLVYERAATSAWGKFYRKQIIPCSG